MRPQANLIRDGIEATAAHVMHRLRGNARRRQTVLVRRYGRVAVCPPTEVADWNDGTVIGTYDSSVPPEVLENDLLCRMRELSELLAECDAA